MENAATSGARSTLFSSGNLHARGNSSKAFRAASGGICANPSTSASATTASSPAYRTSIVRNAARPCSGVNSIPKSRRIAVTRARTWPGCQLCWASKSAARTARNTSSGSRDCPTPLKIICATENPSRMALLAWFLSCHLRRGDRASNPLIAVVAGSVNAGNTRDSTFKYPVALNVGKEYTKCTGWVPFPRK
ncbi:hypothetical protein BC828DRAFT_384377, partial [Blastocladiella britannica]